jgi:hypothetical protein
VTGDAAATRCPAHEWRKYLLSGIACFNGAGLQLVVLMSVSEVVCTEVTAPGFVDSLI